jgi:hypothetical protein
LVKLRAFLAPYLLIGVLALGVGLGAGLGLSEAPVARAAPSHPAATSAPSVDSRGETCTTFTGPSEVGIRCTEPGFSSQVSFKISTHAPRRLAQCLSKVPTGVLPRGSTGLGAIKGMIRACGTNGGAALDH